MINEFNFILAPFVGYLVAGSIKFAINSIKLKKIDLKKIGLGGFPSTHNTITSTIASNIGFSVGFNTNEFSICLGLMLIVFIDSTDLRQKLSKHAIAINNLSKKENNKPALKENIGHSIVEGVAGIILGFVIGFFISK